MSNLTRQAYSPSFGGSAWGRPLAHFGEVPLECRATSASAGWLIPRGKRQSRACQVVLRFARLSWYSTLLGTEGIKWVEGASNDTNLGPFARKNHQKQEKRYFPSAIKTKLYTLCFFPMLIYKFKVISIKCLKEFYLHLHKPTKCIWRRKELK